MRLAKKRIVLGYCLTTVDGGKLSDEVYKNYGDAEDACFTGAYIADYVDYVDESIDVEAHIASLDINWK